MPGIDVTDILADTFIAGEQFCVIRRPDVVGPDGVTTIGAVKYFAVGSITPTGASSMLRQEAFTTDEKTIRVMTAFSCAALRKTRQRITFSPTSSFGAATRMSSALSTTSRGSAPE